MNYGKLDEDNDKHLIVKDHKQKYQIVCSSDGLQLWTNTKIPQLIHLIKYNSYTQLVRQGKQIMLRNNDVTAHKWTAKSSKHAIDVYDLIIDAQYRAMKQFPLQYK